MSFFSVTITEAGVQELAGDCFLTPPTFRKDGGNLEGLARTVEATWTVELVVIAETPQI